MSTVRRTYKDSLFRHLFGREEHRGNALELYNALRGTSHTDPAKVVFNTIDSFVYLGYRNDVSFLIDDEMLLLEHQSTHSPNIPLRGLLYFAKLYTKYIEEHRLDLYGSKTLKVPTPRFLVLYFGSRNLPDRGTLSLSSLFASGPGDIEVTATVLNCNEGRNEAIMDASETLRGYAHLLALVRNKEASGLNLDQAVDSAIGDCIAEGVLASYLKGHHAEVRDMLFTMEYEETARQIHEEAIERDAQERGFKAGHDAGFEDGLKAGRDAGFKVGRDAGFSAGRDAGLNEGVEQERKRVVEALKKAGIDPSVVTD